MKLSEILRDTPVMVPGNLASLPITDITNDSRRVSPGSLFVAIKGFTSDGHNYIQKALEAGAQAAVTEKPVSIPGVQGILLNPSGSNRELLSMASAAFFRYPWLELRTAGITGTNGKTSTAHMLRWILEKNGTGTGIMGTVGHIAAGEPIEASVTTPDSLEVARYMRRMADGGDGACVMEVSSHALALNRVSSVRFDIALFTNISQDHLDFHRDMHEYLEAKKKLFHLLKDCGKAVVGTYAPGWPAVDGAITFGERPEDHFRITGARTDICGSTFILETPASQVEVNIPAPGRFNVYNAAGAVAAGVSLGVSPENCAGALESFRGVPGRMETVSRGQDFLVAVDYAHTPDALERVLSQGRLIARGKLIAVFGCGGDRDPGKRPVMGGIAAREADLVIITSDNPRTEDPGSIISDILRGVPAESPVVVEQDRKRAIHRAIETASPGDVVIIAGKGHEDYQILGREKIHFDDREHAAEALQERGFNCVH